MNNTMDGRSGRMPLGPLARLAAVAAIALFSSCVVGYDTPFLSVASVSATSITLEFAQPGVDLDDGSVDHASAYDFRCSTVLNAIFEEMPQVPPSLIPEPTLDRGMMIRVTLPDLQQGQTYEIAMRALYTDPDGLEYFAESNRVQATVQLDDIAPAAITDLAVSGTTEASVTLSWTAVGDDNMTGTASTIDLRYSSAGPIVGEAGFSAATPVATIASPLPPGTAQSATVGGLAPLTTYHFAIRTVDNVGNRGPLAPIGATATTLEHIPGGDSGSKAQGACGGSATGSTGLAIAGAMILGLLAARRG